MTTEQIIDCGGIYEVHPAVSGGYAVVNSNTGEVVSNASSKREAIKVATECNAR